MKPCNSLFAGILIISSLMHADSRDFPPITLTDPKLKLVDGFSWAMDGKQYKKTMKFRMQLNQRRFGEKTSQGLIGFYLFEDTKYSLAGLIELENILSASNNISDQIRLKKLYEFLKAYIVEEFIALSQPFLADARGAKKDMMALITEWANKTSRKDSYLLAWGASKEGEETMVVRTKIQYVRDLEQFFADLVYFLETLMRSCPIATAQFKELLKKDQQAAQQNQK